MNKSQYSTKTMAFCCRNLHLRTFSLFCVCEGSLSANMLRQKRDTTIVPLQLQLCHRNFAFLPFYVCGPLYRLKIILAKINGVCGKRRTFEKVFLINTESGM